MLLENKKGGFGAPIAVHEPGDRVRGPEGVQVHRAGIRHPHAPPQPLLRAWSRVPPQSQPQPRHLQR
jgi:hypothetical protein